MPEFETYVDVDVDEYWNICSRREKDELIDLIENEGWVKRTVKKGEKPSGNTQSILEIEWDEMCSKLNGLRLRIQPSDEDIIKQILSKY